MPIIITQIKSSLDEKKENIVSKALKSVKISYKDVLSSDIYKTSLDARHHNDIHFVHSVYCELNDDAAERMELEKTARMLFG